MIEVIQSESSWITLFILLSKMERRTMLFIVINYVIFVISYEKI
jgi:hypothetical protein